MSDDRLLDQLEPGDPRPPVVDRARADLAAGRPWVAANRLQSHLAHDPFDAESRELLVEVHLGMGDDVAAGRVAIATEREDSAALDAIAAWRRELDRAPAAETRRLRSQALLDPAVVAELGQVGRARVEPLARFARDQLGPVKPRDYAHGGRDAGETAALIGCAVGVLTFATVVVAGVIQIAHWLGV